MLTKFQVKNESTPLWLYSYNMLFKEIKKSMIGELLDIIWGYISLYIYKQIPRDNLIASLSFCIIDLERSKNVNQASNR